MTRSGRSRRRAGAAPSRSCAPRRCTNSACSGGIGAFCREDRVYEPLGTQIRSRLQMAGFRRPDEFRHPTRSDRAEPQTPRSRAATEALTTAPATALRPAAPHKRGPISAGATGSVFRPALTSVPPRRPTVYVSALLARVGQSADDRRRGLPGIFSEGPHPRARTCGAIDRDVSREIRSCPHGSEERRAAGWRVIAGDAGRRGVDNGCRREARRAHRRRAG